MRPAVYASVVRNRKQSARRARGPHEFSMRRMILMLFIGSLLVIFGLIVTIIGIVNGGDIDDVQGDGVLYKVIGPAGLACGIGLVVAGGIYYCCWGYRPGSRSRHTSNYSYDNKNDNNPAVFSKADESLPEDAIAGSFDVKLEMTDGV